MRGASPGERRGGRIKGTPNRKTAEQAALIAETGATPLEYLVSVFRNGEVAMAQRVEAAKAAAPYVHPRLSAVDMTVDGAIGTYDISDAPMTADEWEAAYCVPLGPVQ